MASSPIKTVNEYIAGFTGEVQERLIILREIIRKAAPNAEEMISYNMPLYKYNGMLVSFAAWKTHIGLYPTPKATGEFKRNLKPYEGAKSTLRFPHKEKLPATLITKLVKMRMKENENKYKVGNSKQAF